MQKSLLGQGKDFERGSEVSGPLAQLVEHLTFNQTVYNVLFCTETPLYKSLPRVVNSHGLFLGGAPNDLVNICARRINKGGGHNEDTGGRG